METPVSDIQVESKDETGSAEVRAQDERQEEKASMLCFKRRKKSAKATKPKAGPGAVDAARQGAGASDQPQPPAGAWASLKRLVTRRKSSGSSKLQRPSEANVQPEVGAEDAPLPKRRAKSRLRIPCLKFSKGEKRHNHSELTEDADRSVQVQGEAERLDTKTPPQPGDDQATKTTLTHGVSGEAPQNGGEAVCESNVSSGTSSPGGKVVSVELGLEKGHSAIQTGTLILEQDIETAEEKPSVQPQQTRSPETSGTEHQLPAVSAAERSPAAPDQQVEEDARNHVPESEPNGKAHEGGEVGAEEMKPEDEDLSREPDVKGTEVSAEEPKPEENKRMEPIAIIITDTEISEFDVKKSKNVPKKFLISIENEEVGGFEGRTSEQYETLLIETASSLVKRAIQLSIEQLVNEMASGDNTINNLLQ